MEYTGQICDVSPFLGSYEPVKEIPVAQCYTVWTDDTTGMDYLLVADEMLWFGTTLQHSLLNPNQIGHFGVPVNDNPFEDLFGLNVNATFILFETIETIVHFETCVPNDWEKKHLPVLLVTDSKWNPSDVQLGCKNLMREQQEIHTIQLLYSGYSRAEIKQLRVSVATTGTT